ncbi:MAG: hypothetical protein ACFE8O_05400 [Candidatus Hermodarchaeota archaeon]
MPTPRDISDYQRHLSNVMSYCALLTGFILTVFTLLLTLLPYSFLSSLWGQIALFFVAILFYMFLLYGLLFRLWGFQWVKWKPPISWQTHFLKGFFILAILFFGFLIPLLFLVWGFFVLAVIMGIVWMVFFVFYLLYDKVTVGSPKRGPD